MILLDASSGASGDMFLGALVDLGGDRNLLSEVEEVVPVEFEFERVTKAGVNSLKVNVLGGGDDANDDHAHRSYDEVVSLVEGARGGIPDPVVDNALSVFERIGRAEAEVHGVELDELDFHEVGADDAIADVLGVSLLLHDLGYPDEDVVVNTLSVGGGRVDAAHGSMPVPVPAVVEILKNTDHTTVGGPVDSELLTPTGAALVAEFTRPVDEPPRVNVDATGYGAGSKEFDHPNVLRAVEGSTPLEPEGIELLETNLDDVSGEVLGSLYERLMDEGARDVSVVPVQMKKNRPGHIVKVVARRSDSERLARVLAEETGTLGVRATPYTHRFVADRRVEETEVEIDGRSFGVGVKVASSGDDVFDVSAEFEDAKEVADETGLPVGRVMQEAEETWRRGR